MTVIRPDIPGSCAHRPLHGGLVVPWAQTILADGTPDFLSPHGGRTNRCWRQGLCQVCGDVIPGSAVLFGGPNQLAGLWFDEAPLCAACALYSSRACPMLSGRMLRYATHAPVGQGPRGKICPDHGAGCRCGGLIPTDPSQPGHPGAPAHDYWAVWARPGAWQLAGKRVPSPCLPGCQCGGRAGITNLHITGAWLTAVPSKVVHVSTPGQGRHWRRLDSAETAALITSPKYAATARSR